MSVTQEICRIFSHYCSGVSPSSFVPPSPALTTFISHSFPSAQVALLPPSSPHFFIVLLLPHPHPVLVVAPRSSNLIRSFIFLENQSPPQCTLQNNPSSRPQLSNWSCCHLKMGPKICTEISITNCKPMPHNITEERTPQPEGSLLFSKHAEPDKYSSRQTLIFVCLD